MCHLSHSSQGWHFRSFFVSELWQFAQSCPAWECFSGLSVSMDLEVTQCLYTASLALPPPGLNKAPESSPQRCKISGKPGAHLFVWAGKKMWAGKLSHTPVFVSAPTASSFK